MLVGAAQLALELSPHNDPIQNSRQLCCTPLVKNPIVASTVNASLESKGQQTCLSTGRVVGYHARYLSSRNREKQTRF